MYSPKKKIDDLIYPELSYKIIGCAFEVHNKIGIGYPEKYYQKSLSVEFKLQEIKFAEQVFYPFKYKEHLIGKNYLDFIVEEKIVVEIKRYNQFSKAHFDQVIKYLNVTGLQLALLITFGKEGVSFKRIVKTR